MTKSIALRFALVTGTAALVVATLGSAEARDIKIQRKMVVTPVVETIAPPTIAAPMLSPDTLRASAAASTVVAVAASPCGRKVKIVYSGYGEAERAQANCDAPTVTLATQ